MAASLPIRVTDNLSKNPSLELRNSSSSDKAAPSEIKPAHWVDAHGKLFQNPWPSYRIWRGLERLSLALTISGQMPTPPPNVLDLLPVHTPTWGIDNVKEDGGNEGKEDKIKATWLGHACFLVEFPTREAGATTRGARVLFDPVFSARCSPSQWVGPKRYTPPPCKIEDIPELDAIVISHNHYDHLDTHTIRTLFKRPRTPHIFIPLGNQDYLNSIGVPASHTHIMDWWDSKRLEVTIPLRHPDESDSKAERETKLVVDITCTPAQHFTGRSLFDTFKTLWASWVVEEVVPPNPQVLGNNGATASGSQRPPLKVFFAGDTGYRSVMDHQDEDKVPTCPVFKEIGERFGGFDFAMIPIGAYMPRQFMSPIHCAPQDSVRLFKDLRAKKALGMHWATWVVTSEDIFEPPKKLAEECKKIGIDDGDFGVCDIGQTMLF